MLINNYLPYKFLSLSIDNFHLYTIHSLTLQHQLLITRVKNYLSAQAEFGVNIEIDQWDQIVMDILADVFKIDEKLAEYIERRNQKKSLREICMAKELCYF